jgi:hypothetical protein
MRKRFAVLAVAALAVAAAGPAAPQTPAPAPSAAQPAGPSPAAERPAGTPLKLRLDEITPSGARVTFGPQDGATDKSPADGLPELGGRPARSFDAPSSRSDKSSPFPKDTNPGL